MPFRLRKVRKLCFVAALVPCLAAGLMATSRPATTPASDAAGPGREIKDDTIRLIYPPAGAMEYGLHLMMVWPTAEDIDARYAEDDISRQLPARPYPHGGKLRRQPPKALWRGGVSPQAAVDDSVKWCPELLQKRWLMNATDLKEIMLPLRDKEQAQYSKTWVRYSVDGHAIQVCQMRWIACIVIKPDFERGKNAQVLREVPAREKLVRDVAERFLKSGPEFAAAPLKEVNPLISAREWGADPRAETYFALDDDKLPAKQIVPGSLLARLLYAYTDGGAICFWIKKTEAGHERDMNPLDRWF